MVRKGRMVQQGISGALFFWADVLAVRMSSSEQELERLYFPGYEI